MKDFLQHIDLKNQKFKCYLCTDESETLNLTVNITNKLNSGGKENEIEFLKNLMTKESEEIFEFYKVHNGIELYCNKDTSGIQFYSISDLKDLNEEWKEGFSDYEEDELYEFQKQGVAFGEICHSGNYFILFEGKVYYDDHDGGDDTVIGETFNNFLSKIANDPADFLYELGCYTRYSDEKTDGQYIPKEFIADEN